LLERGGILKNLDIVESNILNFIINYKKDFGKPPTMKGLSDGTGLNNVSLEINLDSLSKKGYIYYSSNVHRSLQVLKLP